MEVLPSGLRRLGKTVPRLYHLVRIVGLLFIGLTAIFLQQAGEQEARRLTTLIHVFLALGKTEVEIAKQRRVYHLGFLAVLSFFSCTYLDILLSNELYYKMIQENL